MLKCLSVQMNNAGFTLVELLVSIFIILLMSGIIFANYRAGEQKFALQRSANKLAQDIRRAQQMAMSATECPTGTVCMGQIPLGGYGIYLTIGTPESYILFADCDGDYYYDGASEKIGDPIEFEEGIEIDSLSPSPLTIIFTPPDPTVTINTGASASITLSINSQSKTIKVNEAGLIEIE